MLTCNLIYALFILVDVDENMVFIERKYMYETFENVSFEYFSKAGHIKEQVLSRLSGEFSNRPNYLFYQKALHSF